ncbi:Isonitrile hydratase [Diplonema papillatum]|nr:Isonitrile hydratase [Diplonema papillatum]
MHVGILVYENAEVLDFSGPFEVFATAARFDEKFRPSLISEEGGAVKARAGFTVVSQYSIADHPPIDVLLVPGGVHLPQLSRPKVIDWIAEQARSVPIVASVCTGAFLLAKAGLLDGLTVTTHWDDIAGLQEMFPKMKVEADRVYVDNGSRVTSAGISAGIDMSLHLVRRLGGAELAQKTARVMEYNWSADSPSP